MCSLYAPTTSTHGGTTQGGNMYSREEVVLDCGLRGMRGVAVFAPPTSPGHHPCQGGARRRQTGATEPAPPRTRDTRDGGPVSRVGTPTLQVTIQHYPSAPVLLAHPDPPP